MARNIKIVITAAIRLRIPAFYSNHQKQEYLILAVSLTMLQHWLTNTIIETEEAHRLILQLKLTKKMTMQLIVKIRMEM